MAEISERFGHLLNMAYGMHIQRSRDLSLMANQDWMTELREHVDQMRVAASDIRETSPPPIMEPAHDAALRLANLLDDISRMLGSDDITYIINNEPILAAKVDQFISQANRTTDKVKEVCGRE